MRLRRLMGFVCALALSVSFPIARPAARAAGAAARADEADPPQVLAPVGCPLRKAAHRYRSAAALSWTARVCASVRKAALP